MEHVMNASLRGQLQAHGCVVDELDDAVWLEEASLQLARCRLGKRRWGALAETKKRPVAHLIGNRVVLLIVVAFLNSLRLL